MCVLAPSLVYVTGVVPSPQFTIHSVTVSSPGSVIAPKVSVYSIPSLTLSAPVTAIVGDTPSTVTVSVPLPTPLSLSSIRTVTVYWPLSAYTWFRLKVLSEFSTSGCTPDPSP